MAVKTITIDLEAYHLLAGHKDPGRSFSQVIKAHFGGPPTVATFKKAVKRAQLGESALDAIEAQVRARRRHPARIVRL